MDEIPPHILLGKAQGQAMRILELEMRLHQAYEEIQALQVRIEELEPEQPLDFSES
jgi:hypothetical protein